MHQRQHDGLREWAGSVQRHDDLWVRPREQLTELADVLRAQDRKVSVIPLLWLTRSWRSRTRQRLLLRRKGRGSGGVRSLRCRDVRAKPRAVHDRRLRRLRGLLLEGRMRLVTGGLGHGAHIGLTEELRQLVGRDHTGARCTRGRTILHMTEIGRGRRAHEILHLLREQADRLLQVANDRLYQRSRSA